MSLRDIAYHRAREIQELARAGSSDDPAVRASHERLAAMHAAERAKARLKHESGVGDARLVVRDPSTLPTKLAAHLIEA
jgi:hypothetical protein